MDPRDDYAEMPSRGRPWTLPQLAVLIVIVLFWLFLAGVALEVARVVHWGSLWK